MSIRHTTHTSKRAFRPAFDDLEGRRMLVTGPAVAAFRDVIYFAAEKGALSRDLIIIGSWDNAGKTFHDRYRLSVESNETPALAVFNGRLYIAWTGREGVFNDDRFVNIMSTSNGVNWGNKVTLPELTHSETGPALAAFDGQLYVAWTGKDHHLNVESSSNGVSWGNKVTLPETSQEDPGLASFNGRLFIGWKGTDDRPNVESSSDGVAFGNKVTYGGEVYTDSGPDLADVGGSVDMDWLSGDKTCDGCSGYAQYLQHICVTCR
jgi:hypothetical protein